MLERARAAFGKAYAPYSSFRVGAATLAVGGEVYSGSNIENASYGLTLCAERVAIFSAISEGVRQLSRLAISTERPPSAPEEGMPCGACRQVMAEFMRPDARIVVDHVGGFTLAELLPTAFRLTSPA